MKPKTFAPGRPLRRARRGYALVSSLVAVLVLLTVGASLFSTADTGARLANRRLISAQADDLAFASADLALRELRSNRLYTGFGAQALGEGTMEATVVPVSGQPTMREITGIGKVAGRLGTVSKRVRYTVDLNGLPPALQYTLIVDQSISMNGNIGIVPSDLANPVSVHTNGDANLSGSAIGITGAFSASGDINVSGKPKVTGGLTEHVSEVPFPVIDDDFKGEAVADGATFGTRTVSDGSLLKGVITGDLTISTPLGCRVDGVVWVTGKVTVKGPVNGNGTFVAEGKLDLQANQTIALGDTSSILFITLSSADDAASMQGNAKFKGMIYAPNGGLKMQGNPTLIGSVCSKSVSLGGSPTILGWDGFFMDPPPTPGAFRVLGWQAIK